MYACSDSVWDCQVGSDCNITKPFYLSCSGAKMDMTTPVFTTAGQGSPGTMSFPVEERMGEDPERLPIPNDARYPLMSNYLAWPGLGGDPLTSTTTQAR